jgi:hypothetical protein
VRRAGSEQTCRRVTLPCLALPRILLAVVLCGTTLLFVAVLGQRPAAAWVPADDGAGPAAATPDEPAAPSPGAAGDEAGSPKAQAVAVLSETDDDDHPGDAAPATGGDDGASLPPVYAWRPQQQGPGPPDEGDGDPDPPPDPPLGEAPDPGAPERDEELPETLIRQPVVEEQWLAAKRTQAEAAYAQSRRNATPCAGASPSTAPSARRRCAGSSRSRASPHPSSSAPLRAQRGADRPGRARPAAVAHAADGAVPG